MADTYTTYTKGIQDATGSAYNFLVSGKEDYTSSGLMIKGDTKTAKGTRIFQDSSDNAFLDLRSGTSNSISFRLEDHTLGNKSTMLKLQTDDKSSTDRYGAEVGGRVKASQLYVSEADTRAPVNQGIYLGQDADLVAYMKNNKGDGDGGFKFETFAADGVAKTVNLLLNPDGTVTIPTYAESGNADDSEYTGIAAFDMNGNLVRHYNTNKRLRSINTRAVSLSQNQFDVANKINQVIGRLNETNFFSVGMEPLVARVPFTAPMPGLYAVDQSTARDPGAFTAFVVYESMDAFQLDSSMMVTGNVMEAPYDIDGWAQIGNFQSGDHFDISYYYNAPVLAQLVERAAKKTVAKANAKTAADGLVYKGMAPWKGANWKSIISVR